MIDLWYVNPADSSQGVLLLDLVPLYQYCTGRTYKYSGLRKCPLSLLPRNTPACAIRTGGGGGLAPSVVVAGDEQQRQHSSGSTAAAAAARRLLAKWV